MLVESIKSDTSDMVENSLDIGRVVRVVVKGVAGRNAWVDKKALKMNFIA